MYKTKIFLILLILSGVTFTAIRNHDEVTEMQAMKKKVMIDTFKEIPIKPIEKVTAKVTVTMYNAVRGQCDSSPLITADNSKINPRKASEHRWIAMSRDQLSRWGGLFNYGDRVKITGTDHKDGIYEVRDTMNPRYTKRIDILETSGTKMYKFYNITIEKVS